MRSLLVFDCFVFLSVQPPTFTSIDVKDLAGILAEEQKAMQLNRIVSSDDW
jgi:hypothetical protein